MKRILFAFLFVFAVNSGAKADSIKLPLGDSGPDVSFDGTTFGTVDDGNAATSGEQNTRVLYVGFGGAFTDITDAIASFTLDGITTNGNATTSGGVILQQTSGGTFSLWAPDNTLLVSGTLAGGSLNGSSASDAGSFFTTQAATFTGGTLAAFFDANTASLSVAMNSILSGALQNLHLTDGKLGAFTADASVIINGSPSSTVVPEPGTMLLLLSGGAAAALRRRQAKA